MQLPDLMRSAVKHNAHADQAAAEPLTASRGLFEVSTAASVAASTATADGAIAEDVMLDRLMLMKDGVGASSGAGSALKKAWPATVTVGCKRVLSAIALLREIAILPPTVAPLSSIFDKTQQGTDTKITSGVLWSKWNNSRCTQATTMALPGGCEYETNIQIMRTDRCTLGRRRAIGCKVRGVSYA